MQIGPLVLENPTLLAPLAGITHLPFRLLVREAGCALVCTEMVSAEGLTRGSRHTLPYLRSLPAEKPLAVQIFGSDPDIMAEAAVRVEESGADVIDINFGCAVRKVIRSGAGVALMRTPQRAESVLRAVRHAVRIPVTIKIRSGWNQNGTDALTIARIAESCGVDAITLHPRTAAQRFSGQADWSLIARVKRATRIPVIGNGDIRSAEDAERMLVETGCDAVMIGRRAVGDPRFFKAVIARLQGRSLPPETPEERFELMKRYVAWTEACYGEETAQCLVRNRLGWFARGLRCASRFRQAAAKTNSISEALEVIDTFRRAADPTPEEKMEPALGGNRFTSAAP
jgi:tRNA-dihydrouridine synthase B